MVNVPLNQKALFAGRSRMLRTEWQEDGAGALLFNNRTCKQFPAGKAVTGKAAIVLQLLMVICPVALVTAIPVKSIGFAELLSKTNDWLS